MMNVYKTLIALLWALTLNLASDTLEGAESGMPRKKALIFGITGQDGAYLTKFLLEKGYEVHGVKRPASLPNTSRLDDFASFSKEPNPSFILHYGDLCSSATISNLLQTIRPDEIYNLAAQSHVHLSFSIPEITSDIDALGPLRILEAIRLAGVEKTVKFYQASTSELYGLAQETPQSESTPFHPRSPYAVAKLFAYWITVNYREAYGLFACNGILFNHESPLRGKDFSTRKITLAATRQYCGSKEVLYLGNLDAKRDWGYAEDYVEAMWLMLQQESPSDYVIATGETRSIREFTEAVYKELGIDLEWRGEGVNECGIDKRTGRIVVQIDPQLYRPSEVDLLLGDPTKAKNQLNWKAKTDFYGLVKIMVEADLALAKVEQNSPL